LHVARVLERRFKTVNDGDARGEPSRIDDLRALISSLTAKVTDESGPGAVLVKLTAISPPEGTSNGASVAKLSTYDGTSVHFAM
jgi:hypothetical protein